MGALLGQAVTDQLRQYPGIPSAGEEALQRPSIIRDIMGRLLPKAPQSVGPDFVNQYHDLLVQQSQPHMFSSVSPYDRLQQATDAMYDSLEKYSGKDKDLRWQAIGDASMRAYRTLQDQGYEPPMSTLPTPQSVFGGSK